MYSRVVAVVLLAVFGTSALGEEANYEETTSGSGIPLPAADLSSKWRLSTRCWTSCRCTPDGNATVVNCSYADIDSLPPQVGSGNASMAKLPKSVRTLVADGNRLTAVTFDFQSAAPELEWLSLSQNNITELSSTALRGLRSLRRLDLDDNRISILPVELFADTVSLTELSLSGNQLDTGSVGAALEKLGGTLRRLDVSRTKIGEVGPLPEVVFSRLHVLEELVMREVTTDNLTSDYFAALHSELTKLDMSSSNLNSVNPNAFSHLSSTLVHLVLDNVLISPNNLEHIFAGLQPQSASDTPSSPPSSSSSSSGQVKQQLNSTLTLETLSLRNVFVDDDEATGETTTINSHLFRHLARSRLQVLHFDGNYFSQHGGRIPERLFHPLRNLTLLTLNYCEIRSIPSGTFRGLHHLQTLTLRGNQLSCSRQSDCGFLTSSRSILSRLHTLDLSDNQLRSPNNDDVDAAFNGVQFTDEVFPELAELDLTGNRLSAIPVGMFGNLRRLTRLKLSDNEKLTEIEPRAFEGLTNLVRLELDSCRRLTHLKAWALDGLTSLRVLSIRNSGLVHIHNAALRRLDHLEELILRNNRLGEQDDSIDRVTVKSTSNLKVVDLGGNRLRSMPTGLLVHASQLRAIYVDDNRLTDCSGLEVLNSGHQSHSHVSSELIIDLSNNLIAEPTKTCFEKFQTTAGSDRHRMTSFNLAGNPIHCGSCDTAEFVRWLQSGQGPIFYDRERTTCTRPSNMGGLSAFDGQVVDSFPDGWTCSRWRQNLFDAIVSVLSILIVVMTAIILRRRILQACCRNRCRRSQPSSMSTAVSSSTVTITNGCYGNGSMNGSGLTPTSASCGSVGGSGLTDSTAKYSPLVEDAGCDVIGNGAAGLRSSSAADRTLAHRCPVDISDCDALTSVDIECPLIESVATGSTVGNRHFGETSCARPVSNGRRITNGTGNKLVLESAADLEETL